MASNKHLVLRSSSGFTLVELIVTVAILGILSSVAVASYERMVRKAHQVEAKLSLGALYVAEVAFATEVGSYTSRLDAIGFAPVGKIRYNVGFGTDFVPPSYASQGTPECVALCPYNGDLYCNSPSKSWECTGHANWGTSWNTSAYGFANESAFKASAHTHFVPNADKDEDTWTIDNNKVFTNFVGPN